MNENSFPGSSQDCLERQSKQNCIKISGEHPSLFKTRRVPRQANEHSCLLFIIVLEGSMRRTRSNSRCTYDFHTVQSVCFADDGRTFETVEDTYTRLKHEYVNASTSKCMLVGGVEHGWARSGTIDGDTFEVVGKFIICGSRAYYELQNLW